MDDTTKQVRIEIKVPMDDALIERRGVVMAQLENELKRLRSVIKAEAKKRRKEKAELEDRISVIAEEIESRTMAVVVDATERFQFETNEVITYRETGEIVATRAMSAEERQTSIDIDVDPPLDAREPAKIVRLSGRKKKEPPPSPGQGLN